MSALSRFESLSSAELLKVRSDLYLQNLELKEKSEKLPRTLQAAQTAIQSCALQLEISSRHTAALCEELETRIHHLERGQLWNNVKSGAAGFFAGLAAGFLTALGIPK